MYGILEKNNRDLKIAAMNNNYLITPEMLVTYLLNAQKAKMDAHLLVGGQNGLGKSILQLVLAKTVLRTMQQPESFRDANAKSKLKFFFAYNTREELMRAVQQCTRGVFVIDELRPFFDYKRSLTSAQTSLYNIVEIARSNCNVYIGASRDYTKLDKTYRNAKAQLLIYLIDKVVDFSTTGEDGFYKTKCSYGAVFVGNPSLEYEDKFMFSMLRGYSLETTKYLAEKLPTWVGNMIVSPMEKYGVTKDDLDFYESEKSKGIKKFGVDKPLEVDMNGEIRDKNREGTLPSAEEDWLSVLRGKGRVHVRNPIKSDIEEDEQGWGYVRKE